MKKLLYPLAMCLLFGLCAYMFIGQADRVNGENDRAASEMMAQSLYRGALSCYACEGAYPDTLEYLCEKYGITVDESKYDVHYTIFASNIMPDITVVELHEQ